MRSRILISLLLLTVFSVSFGQIILEPQPPQVKLKDNQLNVSWQIREESDIDYYDILLSKDGTRFKRIGTVKSQRLEENNTGLLDYTFNIDFGVAAKTFGYIGFISMLFSGFSRKRKRSMFLSAIAWLFMIASCKRDEDIANKHKTYFLQIKQVAKNNTALYSYVVKINNKEEE